MQIQLVTGTVFRSSVEPWSEVVILLAQLLVQFIDQLVGLLLGELVEEFICWLSAELLEVDSPGDGDDCPELFRRGRVFAVVHLIPLTGQRLRITWR